MDRPEPADASSSPSADLRLLSVEKRGSRSGVWEITLDNGASFLSPAETAAGLRKGEIRPASAWRELAAQSARLLCYRAALRLLARAEQSVRGLARKLGRRSFDEAVVKETIARLVAEGAVSDTRYAEIWARGRIARKCEGPRLVAAGLAARGVARDTVDEVLRGLEKDGAFALALRRAAARFAQRCDSPARLVARLCRQGFETNQAHRVVRNSGREKID